MKRLNFLQSFRGFDGLFSYLERLSSGDRFLFWLTTIVLVVSIFWSGFVINKQVSVLLPIEGGTLREGIIGTPRFVNPVLAITRADLDLSNLIYSGIMRRTATGDLVEDLADSVTVSSDGKVYSVALRKDVYFHDGQPVTAYDVVYTIELIKDSGLKSPNRGNWNTVKVELISDYEINFILDEAYFPFMENLTQGILPKHFWEPLLVDEIPFSQLNTEPVGSGPYMVTDTKRSSDGLISSYNLTAFTDSIYNPKIKDIRTKFYASDEELLSALQTGDIDSTGALSVSALDKVNLDEFNVIQYPLPRTFGLFLNHNKSAILRDQSIREALNVAIDKQDLVDKILSGYAKPTDSPIPSDFFALESVSKETSDSGAEEAKRLLRQGGWTQSEAGNWVKDDDDKEQVLSLTITTANSTLFTEVADYISEVWRNLGIQVEVAKFEQSDLIQSVIRTRDYELLLFGTDVGRSLDLYPFWHSSQREDPGLNVALYTHIDADAYLENFRTESDPSIRSATLQKLNGTIVSETPAIFLFNPTFVYVTNKEIGVFAVERISKPSDRFDTIPQWHISEASVWPLFTNKK